MPQVIEPNLTLDRMIIKIPDLGVGDDYFLQVCQTNPDYRIERYGKKDIIIMTPTFSKTGNINFELALQLGKWNEIENTGLIFDSSTGFKMPDDSILSPDLAWVARQHWEVLSQTQQEDEFAPLCPDFLLEVRSKTDRLTTLQKKMQKWLAYGCQEAWLIDTVEKRVYIYLANLKNPQNIDDLSQTIHSNFLKGFSLNLNKIL
jgi:Uma2 family endonuclease